MGTILFMYGLFVLLAPVFWWLGQALAVALASVFELMQK